MAGDAVEPGGERDSVLRSKSLTDDRVRRIYDGWAGIYDWTFGLLSMFSRRTVAEHVNCLSGTRVLEVGVGTGASLPLYSPDKKVVGIDIAPDMIAQSKRRIQRKNLDHVNVQICDGETMPFADGSFDIVVANHVLSVAPDPEALCREISRVCKPDGDIFIANHFRSSFKPLAWLEKILSPYSGWIGWRTDFDDSFLGQTSFVEISRGRIKGFFLFTLMHLRNVS